MSDVIAKPEITKAQCLGMIGGHIAQNGFLLSYFTFLSLTASEIAFLLSAYQMISGLTLIPFGFISDRYGPKKTGVWGLKVLLFGYVTLWLGALPAIPPFPLMFAVVVVTSTGAGLFGSGWFALIKPLIDATDKGRFFARLRTTFTSVSIAFSWLTTLFLSLSTSIYTFSLIITMIIASAIWRMKVYADIPDLTERRPVRVSFIAVVKACASYRQFLYYSVYQLLYMVFVGSLPMIIGLLARVEVSASSAQLSAFGTLFFVGTMIGCYSSGKIVDTFGGKKVFTALHCSFAVLTVVLLLRHTIGFDLEYGLYAVCVVCGIFSGAYGIASTTLMMIIVPDENKALLTSFASCMLPAGAGIGGVAVSALLHGNETSDQFTMLFGIILIGLALSAFLLRLIPEDSSAYLPQSEDTPAQQTVCQ